MFFKNKLKIFRNKIINNNKIMKFKNVTNIFIKNNIQIVKIKLKSRWPDKENKIQFNFSSNFRKI